MYRYAFMMRLKDTSVIEEYEQLHEDIGKEVLEAHQQAGFRNYSIYRHGLDLFLSRKTRKGALPVLLKNPS